MKENSEFFHAYSDAISPKPHSSNVSKLNTHIYTHINTSTMK